MKKILTCIMEVIVVLGIMCVGAYSAKTWLNFTATHYLIGAAASVVMLLLLVLAYNAGKKENSKSEEEEESDSNSKEKE